MRRGFGAGSVSWPASLAENCGLTAFVNLFLLQSLCCECAALKFDNGVCLTVHSVAVA